MPLQAKPSRRTKIEVTLEEKYLLEAMRSSDEAREAVIGVYAVPLEEPPLLYKIISTKLPAKVARAVLRELKKFSR